jgi:hypothetical protein
MNLVCLVSRQAMANVLPALMFKPKNIFLFCTPQELNCGRHLQSLLTSKGIKVFLFDNIDAYDDSNLLKRLDHVFEKYGENIMLNVTGGTKMMAIPAYEYFRERNKAVFYCNTKNDQIVHLLPDKKTAKIDVDLTIKDYLSAYGYTIEEEKNYSKDLDVNKFIDWVLPDKLESFGSFADKVRKSIKLDEPRITRRFGDFQFEKIFDVSRIKHYPTDTILKVTSNFTHGNWFELVVERIIKDTLKCETKSGVKIVSPGGIKNEIDTLFIRKHQLYLVSCKSGKTEGQGIKEHLAELDVLRNLTGGTFGKALFVYSDKLSDRLSQRAKEFNIQTIPITKLNKYFENEN